ncbi:MAG: Gfo/Idh/MocA family oxidoreductase [Armatimonadetes bacterium]|nr:Gfo/Idh/MocA family oxidoreductase [Armatimonadota bacterium]
MAESYTAAIIGTGGIAGWHMGYYEPNERVDLVAAADINPESLETFGEKYGVERLYLDWEKMLDEVRPDIVSICTWNATHPPMTIAAAEAGAKGIICEKPLGEDLGGPLDAVAACERTGCKLTVHEQRRYMPGFAAARELITGGAIGAPVVLCWRNEGGLLNIGTHFIDAANFVLGDPDWTRVIGWIQRNTDRYERGSYCEEKTHALVDFDGGHQLRLAMDIVEGEKTQLCSATGPDGLMYFDRETVTIFDADGRREVDCPAQPDFLEDLLIWIEGGPEHRNAARHALRTQQIMMAIYQSARTRTVIEPPYTKRESPLAEMIEAGELPAEGEPYDIRSAAAMKFHKGKGE